MPLTDPETLARVGARLRARRQDLGLTLDELGAATIIRVHYLSAIERGEPDKLPGDAYLNGFVRVYAERVGLDVGTLLGACEAKDPAATDKPHPTTSPRRRGRRPTRRTWLLAVLLAVALAVIAARHASTPPARTVAVRSPKPVEQPTALPPKVPVAVQPSGASGGVVAYRVSGASAITVQAQATGRCWVDVQADGKPIFARTLLPGQDATWRAQRGLQLQIGDFGTVRLTVDGVPLGSLPYRSPSTLDFQLVAARTG